MRFSFIIPLLLIICINILSCTDDDNNLGQEEEIIELPITGSYKWIFEIPGVGNQVSRHVFDNDMIAYTMRGDAYNVDYNMDILTYDRDKQKIIAIGEEGGVKNGVYFAIFLKDITSNSVSIYKAELETNEDALNMEIPAPDDLNFHGWNTYLKE